MSSGRVAFVTGIARGMGRAHAVRLAKAGCDVIGLDICAALPTATCPGATRAELAETVSLVEATGARIVARVADVRDLDAVESVLADGHGEFGRLDIVVANAGIASGGRTWELTPQQWHEVIDVNLTGVWHTVRASVPRLLEHGTGGSIVLVSSVGGLRGLPFLGHYNAAKHGVVGLCRTLANELGEYDIRVNSIHPAGVNTALLDLADLRSLIAAVPDTLGPIYSHALPHRWVEPEDVAELVAWLVSDENRYMTGAQIPVDLGSLVR